MKKFFQLHQTVYYIYRDSIMTGIVTDNRCSDKQNNYPIIVDFGIFGIIAFTKNGKQFLSDDDITLLQNKPTLQIVSNVPIVSLLRKN